MNQSIKHWILLPGLDGSGYLFDAFIESYKKYSPDTILEVIALPNKCLSYHQLIEYVLTQLPKDKEFGLLGESFSGPIAIDIASKGLKNLKALCLVATFAKSPHWSYRYLSYSVKYIPKLLNMTKTIGHLILGNSFNEENKVNLQRSLSQINQVTLKSRLIEVSRFNFEDKLEKINIPTLIINATQDLIVSRKTAHNLSQIKNSIDYWIDSPHLILQTQSHLCVQLLKSFSEENAYKFLNKQ